MLSQVVEQSVSVSGLPTLIPTENSNIQTRLSKDLLPNFHHLKSIHPTTTRTSQLHSVPIQANWFRSTFALQRRFPVCDKTPIFYLQQTFTEHTLQAFVSQHVNIYQPPYANGGDLRQARSVGPRLFYLGWNRIYPSIPSDKDPALSRLDIARQSNNKLDKPSCCKIVRNSDGQSCWLQFVRYTRDHIRVGLGHSS
jgi:hypothetical protein